MSRPADEVSPPTLVERCVYWTGWGVCRSLMTLLYRYRAIGADRMPGTGGCLIVSNHQSFMDPPIIGCAVRGRSVNFIARIGLYKNPLFGWAITKMMSIPIREDSSDVSAMKEAIKRINAGRCVCIFAEGTRTPDGTLQPFKRGVALLLKRAKCPVIPVALEGAHDVFPRGRSLPKLTGRVACIFGEPIGHDELLAEGPDAAVRRISEAVETLRLELREEMRERSNRKYPRDRVADDRASWLEESHESDA
jgi:1-acyl-sn-glycerol-3-phosphate acyltransferase